MATVAHGWYLALQKLLVLLSLALGLMVIAVCTNTSMKVIKASNSNSAQNGTDNSTVNQDSEPEHRIDILNLPDSLRKALIACSVIGIIAGSIQSFVSLCNLFSCAKNSASNTRIWLSIHSLIFITLLVCILLPFSFKNDVDGSHDINGLAENTNANLKYAYIRSIAHLKNLDFQAYVNDVINTYFAALIVNETIIFGLMIINCCCMRCGFYEYDNLDESLDGKYYH
ncbi:unnamed protein product [Allacma fusca]|uniref:Uncharacterized protein n=1 Tax=Allacma fusca TaxID=39272 RepID=A0A8J2PMF7_9HEXA|nr:unnamed protein product [Allacma fusca]